MCSLPQLKKKSLWESAVPGSRNKGKGRQNQKGERNRRKRPAIQGAGCSILQDCLRNFMRGREKQLTPGSTLQVGHSLPHKVISCMHLEYTSVRIKWFHCLREDTVELHTHVTGQSPMKLIIAVVAGGRDR